MATAKIRTGMADCIIAGGTESMSMVPTAGWKTVPAYSITVDEPDYYLSMGLKPIGRLVNCASAGVHPRIMGIGPIAAVPKVLKQAGMNLDQIDLFELNEAFASQSLAVIRELGLDINKVNINGGAIALGHPLGCTGSKLTVQIINDLERLKLKYGIVTACVGGGQGIAGIIERL